MASDELKFTEKDKIIVDMANAREPELSDTEVVKELDRETAEQNKLKKEGLATPTYNPKTFYEQFTLYDGHLWVNINNTWVKIANFNDI